MSGQHSSSSSSVTAAATCTVGDGRQVSSSRGATCQPRTGLRVPQDTSSASIQTDPFLSPVLPLTTGLECEQTPGRHRGLDTGEQTPGTQPCDQLGIAVMMKRRQVSGAEWCVPVAVRVVCPQPSQPSSLRPTCPRNIPAESRTTEDSRAAFDDPGTGGPCSSLRHRRHRGRHRGHSPETSQESQL